MAFEIRKKGDYMDEERKELFRGSLEECLRHLSASLASKIPKGSRRATKAKRPIADFCNVTIGAVGRWLRHARPSVGEPLIKLMCYLDMIGYRVVELEKVPKVRKNFAELIGFGLFSSQQATELIGYTTPSTLYQVLQGNHGVSEEKDQKMWDIWKSKKGELESKKKESREMYSLPILSEAPMDAKKEEIEPTGLPRRTATIGLTEDLLALLERKPLVSLSETDLIDLEQSAKTVVHLLRHLNVLILRLLELSQDDDNKSRNADNGKEEEISVGSCGLVSAGGS